MSVNGKVKVFGGLGKRFGSIQTLYLMLLPGIAYFIIFKYLPMWGILLSFKDYSPFLGFFKSPWAGLKHFNRLFTEYMFWSLLRNTMLISIYNLLFFFPLPIILALMLNEVKNQRFKRIVQSLTYMPHFLSWVIIVGIFYTLLTTDGGIINGLLESLGMEKIPFLTDVKWMRPILVIQTVWRELGWGTIIFLAAISSIDVQLYEAAVLDGANRFRQMIHITLPSIMSTIVILLILRLGRIMDTGYEQIYLMLNSMNRPVGEVFDTYVYSVGLTQGQFSYGTAVGLFKSIIGLILVYGSNRISKLWGEEGIF
jgi:putative aldouronate transport system permease protein